MSQRNQKIKLKKRSRQSARIHRGFAMPVGPGSENSLVSFRDFADLKAKYFRFTGRIQRLYEVEVWETRTSGCVYRGE